MKLKLTYILVFALGLFAAIKPLPDIILNYSGQCIKENYYYEEKELTDLVVSNLIREVRDVRVDGYEVDVDGSYVDYYSKKNHLQMGQTQDQSLLYTGLEDFYVKNPDCCSFITTAPGEGRPEELSLLSRLSGRVRTVVRIFYVAGFDVQNNNQPLYRVIYQPISNCGEFVRIPEFSVSHY